MQASVRRFCPLHKTINRGNGTEYLLRCCSAARILHSERPAFTCDCRSHGWVAQLAEQWTALDADSATGQRANRHDVWRPKTTVILSTCRQHPPASLQF